MQDQQADASNNGADRSASRPGETSGKIASDHPLVRWLSRLLRLSFRRWIALPGIAIPAFLALLFLLLWLFRSDRLPSSITLATGPSGGSYHVFGEALCDVILSSQPRVRTARAVESHGSGENVTMIEDGAVNLGMYQSGTVDLGSAAVVAPLYREVVHVLVKKEVLTRPNYEGRELTGDMLRDILVKDGGEVYAGSSDSGMRCSAEEILAHYGIQPSDVHFVDEQTPSTLVAISTTGMFSRAMRKRLRSGDWQYLSLDANAVAARHAHFAVHTIHRASYRDMNAQPVPKRDVVTVATTAFLIAHRDAPPRQIKAALDALYSGDLGERYPDLIPRHEVREYLHGIPLHREAREYFYPYDYGPVVRAIESLAATKELLVALGAGLYVLWRLRHRRQERRRKAEEAANRLRLNQFVDRIVAIESAQMGETDLSRLEEYLEQVTRIKLEALHELTDDGVRGDRAFSIFLMQCANLISKLQLKIIAKVAPRHAE